MNFIPNNKQQSFEYIQSLYLVELYFRYIYNCTSQSGRIINIYLMKNQRIALLKTNNEKNPKDQKMLKTKYDCPPVSCHGFWYHPWKSQKSVRNTLKTEEILNIPKKDEKLKTIQKKQLHDR